MYGKFSKAYYESIFYGQNELLDNPDRLENEKFLAMVSALWYYMTPQYPKPSAHEVITGLFEPNGIDQGNNVGNDFGTTIDIMA